MVDRIRIEGVTCGRNAGLGVLPFIDKDIPSKGDRSRPIPSFFVFAFERGDEILRSTQTSSQISGIFERKKVQVRFTGRIETGNSSNFLVEVVVSDVFRASLVNPCQLDQMDWGPWCDRIAGVRTS